MTKSLLEELGGDLVEQLASMISNLNRMATELKGRRDALQEIRRTKAKLGGRISEGQQIAEVRLPFSSAVPKKPSLGLQITKAVLLTGNETNQLIIAEQHFLFQSKEKPTL